MMEQESMPENKKDSEQELVRLIKEKGLKDPEAIKLFDDWTREQEKQVEQSDNYSLEQILLNLKRARLYFKAGYVKEAFEDFEDARTQAWNERKDELYRAIMEEMDELEKSVGA